MRPQFYDMKMNENDIKEFFNLFENKKIVNNISIQQYAIENGIEIDAYLPGIEKENIELTVLGNVLTIKAERKRDRETITYQEIALGEFKRSIVLKDFLDKNSISSKLKNGVLTIRINNKSKEQVEGKKIVID